MLDPITWTANWKLNIEPQSWCKVILKFWICYLESTRIDFQVDMAFLYCSMSKHLSHNFQDGLVFLMLLLLRPLSLDVTAFPDVQTWDNILFVWSDSLSYSFSICRSQKKIWKSIAFQLAQHHWSVRNDPRVIFLPFSSDSLPWSPLACTKTPGPAQILQKASMHGASTKSSNSIYHKLITKHRKKSKNLRSV